MANATVSRIGAINNAVANKAEIEALFLKLYAGEVITMFEQKCVATDKVMKRPITAGKSAQFPVLGAVGAAYHTPGVEITGRVIKGAERIITLDGVLLSDVFVAEIDELMSHFEVRGPYAAEQGRKLAYQYDEDVFCEIVLAARGSAVNTDHSGGTIITDANLGSSTLATKAEALGKALYAAAQSLDEKNVPEESRFAAFKPAEYYTIVQAVQSNGFSALNKNYGGSGSYSDGNVTKVAGITILKSNRVPSTNLSSKTFHGVNANTTKGIVWTPDAVGVVELMGITTEFGWDIRRQGTLLIAKMAVGMGILRPECAVELRTGNPT